MVKVKVYPNYGTSEGKGRHRYLGAWTAFTRCRACVELRRFREPVPCEMHLIEYVEGREYHVL